MTDEPTAASSSSSNDPCCDGRPHPVPKNEINTHPKTYDEAEALNTWLGRRSVFLTGLKKKPELNDETCYTVRFLVSKQRFEVIVIHQQQRRIEVKFEHIEILTETELERIKRDHPDRALCMERQNQEVMEENRRRAMEKPVSFQDPSKVKKKKGSRGGINPGMCPCCNEPMEECTVEPEQVLVKGNAGMIERLAEDGGRGSDGNMIADFCSYATQDAYFYGYGSILGCDCDCWRQAPIAQQLFHDVSASDGGCPHCGNNPLSYPIKEMFDANLPEAMLKVAWRDDDATRFAAVDLFMVLIVGMPPPQYIYTFEFPHLFRQLSETLGAGKTDMSYAAQHAAFMVYQCALGSRPCDYSILYFRKTFIEPLKEAAESGNYRQLFERRQGYFAAAFLPPAAKFEDCHGRRVGLKLKCDECQKEESTLPKKLSKCSRCSQAFYCNSDCQVAHWRKAHKKVCKKLVEVYNKNKTVACWEPSTDKMCCAQCGFGPVSEKDMDFHEECTGHDIHGVTGRELM